MTQEYSVHKERLDNSLIPVFLAYESGEIALVSCLSLESISFVALLSVSDFLGYDCFDFLLRLDVIK